MELMIQLLMMAAGFVLLIRGADWFVDGASGFASKVGIPQLVIGLTVVAMGTSLPEAAVSISAALKGNAAITIGNVVGSNILNILIILGLTSLLVAVPVARSTVRYEIPYLIAITLVLLAFGYTGKEITLLEGIALWGLFLLYLAYLFVMTKRGDAQSDEAPAPAASFPVWKLLLLIAAGIAMIVLGSNLSVDGASGIARSLGISDRFIGLTIVALGTSLPELVTSVAAARKGNADIAIGNIVGSNLFNILFVVGTTALITPVLFADSFVWDTLIAAGCGVLLLVGTAKNRLLTRPLGVIMLVCYAAYFCYLL